tara:strand:- start:209 stop:841 length:633 start_codon:yes stop_codon:yes gene_type:complete
MSNELKKRVLSSIIVIPISFFFIIKGSFYLIFFLSAILLITIYEWNKICKKNILLKFLGILFLIFSLFSAYYLRETEGLDYFFFVILVCIFTDIGGYIFGKVFNGPKLTKISPNKTYAGMIGSFALAFTAGFLYIEYASGMKSPELATFIIIFFISSVSQVGDLVISFFKRIAKIKNTGKILPGHGGLLDRIDGLIFVFPILYLCSFISL